ncbi:FecR domain-containing protein [Flammeovirgaceae bacterium SG7u.111]|nr:FecR domain-containing protein [Flammeovirgaceae bacterium SG7u.132]WPO36058.1 FecR domain-containing protein [Flammeovirgaceae bacterium SG7u.111]
MCRKHSDEQRAAFEKQIENNPEHEMLNDELKGLMDYVPRSKFMHQCDIDEAWQGVSQKIAVPLDQRLKKSSRKIYWKPIAASLAIFFVLAAAFSFLSNKNDVDAFVIIESNQHVEQVNLPDGSKVTLNKHSTLTYPKGFNKNKREVELEGEAYFEVADGYKSSFVVETKTARVKSAGDEFSICSYREVDHVQVMVDKGEVLLQNFCIFKDTAPVAAGNCAVYMKNKGDINVAAHQDPNYLAWKSGKMVFDNTDLASVFQSLEHLYHVKITSDTLVRNLHLSGSFNYCTLDNFLKELKGKLPVHIVHHGDSVNIQLARRL